MGKMSSLPCISTASVPKYIAYVPALHFSSHIHAPPASLHVKEAAEANGRGSRPFRLQPSIFCFPELPWDSRLHQPLWWNDSPCCFGGPLNSQCSPSGEKVLLSGLEGLPQLPSFATSSSPFHPGKWLSCRNREGNWSNDMSVCWPYPPEVVQKCFTAF